MKKRKLKSGVVMVLAVILAVFLAGCGGDAREDEIENISKKYSVPEEKQLTIYTSHKEEVYLPIIREFEERTGIWVEIHSGGTAEMFENVSEDSEKGECDIMFGGGAEYYEAKKDLFVPYRPSSINELDENYLSGDDLWTPFTELPIVFIYNPKLVSVMDAPKSWRDLFDEVWKGKIAFADMTVSGTSYTILSIMEQLFGENLQSLIPRFYGQLDGNVLESSGDIIPSVETGKCLVGITLEETAKKYIKKGYDIAMIYPSDGTTALPDACAMVKNAPHSYNAGKFIDFIVDYDTQKYAMEQFYRRPSRKDIELSSEYGKVSFIDFDIGKSAEEEKTAMEIWAGLSSEGGN
ncbi:extracellular solute-binding protein [Oribacterium sp. WCC10]|uniref:extracellular solute-binding protein n=1 Tax=Oribacterium sp. WCC10 TaxID=1855343 RepID=UPI0008EA23B9|nr:extracellular solute-binding protein [Oribacterium sp. WCC10]SFG63914.1 iron(III) transport system substrate-binding protein [Oribacterium sp. WCC10]